MFYLISQENLKGCDDQNFLYEYIPNSFMMKPSEFLIKCFFSQIFNLSNKDRIKFIKIKYEPIDFIFSLLNNEKQIFPLSEFIPKLQNIIGYINLCIKYADLNDSSIKNNILYLINLIIDFLKILITYDIDRIQNNENKTILKNQKNEIITKDNNYNGPITLEIHYHRDYVNMDINEFYKKGYKIALKIKEILENNET